jgi:hypothetical protein
MDHRHPVLDEAFLLQITAQLSKQRDELERLRRAVKAASKRREEKVKSLGLLGRTVANYCASRVENSQCATRSVVRQVEGVTSSRPQAVHRPNSCDHQIGRYPPE